MDEREVSGCSSCPLAYLDDDCMPTCVIDDSVKVGADADMYSFRDDAPSDCPLRSAPLLVRLKVKS